MIANDEDSVTDPNHLMYAATTANPECFKYRASLLESLKLNFSETVSRDQYELFITAVLIRFLEPSPKHPRSTLRQQIFESLADIDRQQSSVEITLTQDLGVELSIRVAKYEPQATEKTYRHWKDQNGDSRRHELPAYCIADMEHAHTSMLKYIRRFRGAFLRGLLMRSITADIFDQAQRFSVFAPVRDI